MRTTDIFAVAHLLRESDTTTMRVTGNYYDDLAARFDLSSELLERLQHYQILYNEEDQGVFYQLFTKFFAGKFCLEIVHRNGYLGFRTANAQVRTTMQARELRELGNR